jgi:hypothetical protein
VAVERDQEPSGEEQLSPAGQLVPRDGGPDLPVQALLGREAGPQRDDGRRRALGQRAHELRRGAGIGDSPGQQHAGAGRTRGGEAGERLGPARRQHHGVAERLGAGHVRHGPGVRVLRGGGRLPALRQERDRRAGLEPGDGGGLPTRCDRIGGAELQAGHLLQLGGVRGHADDVPPVLRPPVIGHGAHAEHGGRPEPLQLVAHEVGALRRRLRFDQQRHTQPDRGRGAQQHRTRIALAREDDELSGVEQGLAGAHGRRHEVGVRHDGQAGVRCRRDDLRDPPLLRLAGPAFAAGLGERGARRRQQDHGQDGGAGTRQRGTAETRHGG